MNKPDTKLDECIFVAEKIIPSDICDVVIEDIETRPWESHSWYNKHMDSSFSEETMELDIQYTNLELHKILENFIIESGKKYIQKYTYLGQKTYQIMNQFHSIRFNRYKPGQIMRQHHDHIYNIFDGKRKGIPVLSFILNLNNDYEGGDLFFWKDTIVKLGRGDIVMFPSNFLFPHGVTEVTRGKRYSAVTWGW
jgi:hypothetical protein